MTYYESAEGIMITRERAERLCDEHGVQDYYQLWDEVEFNSDGLCDAQAVLQWLGY